MSAQRIDVTNCSKSEPHHPCDPPLPCDPTKEDEHECSIPYLCLERIKNPALPGEITKCKSGKSINAKSCAKVEIPHPCDSPPPCGTKAQKRPCNDPALCLQRIKNPEPKKKPNPYVTPCTPVKTDDACAADPDQGTSKNN